MNCGVTPPGEKVHADIYTLCSLAFLKLELHVRIEVLYPSEKCTDIAVLVIPVLLTLPTGVRLVRLPSLAGTVYHLVSVA